jgi:uncharacterized protein YkwD
MMRPLRQGLWVPALLASLLLSACGGSDAPSNNTAVPALASAPASNPAPGPAPGAQDANAPQATGDTATDGVNWFNFRRQQMGLPATTRNSMIDTAALGHSNYQRANATITHDQIEGRPGFTGVTLFDRLGAAGYTFTQDIGAYGEVIVRTGNRSGFQASEDLITAIYHRFVIFEPLFREVGAASATSAEGYHYVTTDFAVDGFVPVLGTGNVVTYPFANQQSVPRIFYSDTEAPDPIASKNEVGYPISVHADITSTINVQSFTVQPRGGAPLAVQLLQQSTDKHMSDANMGSAAAIIPLDVLAAGTTYDVRFVGTVDGIAVDRSWSFTTQ